MSIKLLQQSFNLSLQISLCKLNHVLILGNLSNWPVTIYHRSTSRVIEYIKELFDGYLMQHLFYKALLRHRSASFDTPSSQLNNVTYQSQRRLLSIQTNSFSDDKPRENLHVSNSYFTRIKHRKFSKHRLYFHHSRALAKHFLSMFIVNTQGWIDDVNPCHVQIKPS